MKKHFISLILCIAMLASVIGPVSFMPETVTAKGGNINVIASQDTYVQGSSQASIAKGSQDPNNLNGRDWSDKPGVPSAYMLPYLQFEIPSADEFENIDDIQSITLKVFCMSGKNDRYVVGLSELESFDESIFTYNDALKGERTANTSKRLNFDQDGLRIEGSEVAFSSVNNEWLGFNITDKIKQMIASNQSGERKSVVLTLAPRSRGAFPDLSYHGSVIFCSKEYQGGVYAPRIEIKANARSTRTQESLQDYYVDPDIGNVEDAELRVSTADESYLEFGTELQRIGDDEIADAKVILHLLPGSAVPEGLCVEAVQSVDDLEGKLLENIEIQEQTVTVDVTELLLAYAESGKSLILRLRSDNGESVPVLFASSRGDSGMHPILTYDVVYQGTVRSLELEGENQIEISLSKATEKTYSVVAYDQYNEPSDLSGITITYSLDSAPAGVSISENGVLTILPTAVPGTAVIRAMRADMPDICGTMSVEINLIPPETMMVLGAARAGIPEQGEYIRKPYFVEIYNQDGLKMPSVIDLEWSVTGPDGIRVEPGEQGNADLIIENTNNTLKIGDQITLTAKAVLYPDVSASLTVVLSEEDETYNQIVLPVAEDTYIKNADYQERGNNDSGELMAKQRAVTPIIPELTDYFDQEGTNREIYLKFTGLSKIPKQILSAQLQLTTAANFQATDSAPAANMPETQIFMLKNTDWTEESGMITQRLEAEEEVLDSAVYPTAVNSKIKFELTEAMRNLLTNHVDSAAFRVSMEPVRNNGYIHNYYSKDATYVNPETGMEESIPDENKPQLVVSASYVRKPVGLSWDGAQIIGIMLEDVQEDYKIYLVDQYGQRYSDEEMRGHKTSLSLVEEYPGVSLSENTLTVSPEAEPGQIRVRMEAEEYPELTCETQIDLYRSEAAVLRLDGPDTIQIPALGEAVYAQYSMRVFDQQGNEVSIPDAVFELAEPQVGVAVDSATGQVTVFNYAVANREIVLAAYSRSHPAIRVEKQVRLLPVPKQTGKEQHPSLLYGNEDLVALRKKINTEPFATYYSNLKQKADTWTTNEIVYLAQTDPREAEDDIYDHVYPLVEVDESGRERVVDRKRPWQYMMTDLFYTQGNFTFTPPENARYARLQAVAKGQGMTNFDDFSFKIQSGTAIELDNSSMETGNQRYVNEDLPYTDGSVYQVVETSEGGWEYINDVQNPMPDGWYYMRKEGSDTEFVWDNQAYHQDKVVNQGSRAIKVTNHAVSSEAGISTDKIEIVPGQTYVLTTAFGANDKLVGEKGRLKEYEPLDMSAGLSMQVVYYDAEGQQIGTRSWIEGKTRNINWQAKPLRRSFDSAFDACCTVYAITRNLEYAIRAKEILKYQLEDMKWGMKYRTTKGYNTKMNDAYEAVHTGRSLQRVALAYDMIYDSGVLQGEEDAYIRDLFNWVAYELTSTAYYNYAAANGRIHNYNADRISALTLYMLCFPDNTGTVENNYKDKFDFFYDHVLNEKNVWSLPTMFKNGIYDAGKEYGGMWCENMRYHNSVLSGWILAAKALDRYDSSANWLQSDELRKMAKMWCTTQGPRLVVSTTARNLAGYPTVGDSSWRESVDMAAWCASIYQKTDPELSKELMYTWDRMGSQLGGSYPINILMDIDTTLPRKNPQLNSMSLENVGYTYFWQNFDVLGKENFVLIPNSPGYGNKKQPIHDHHDRGSFAYIANGTPMSLDSGMGSYFGSDSAFWRSSKSHNEILFWSDQQGEWLSNAGGDGNSYTSDTGKKRYYDSETKEFYTSAELDRVTINVNPAVRDKKETNMQWNRHFAYIKDGINALIFWDEVKNTRRSQFNLFMASTDYTQNGDMVLAQMQNNMQMEVHLLGSDSPEIVGSWVPSAGKYSIPTVNGEEQQQRIQYEQENGEDYLTVLFAKNNGASGLNSSKIQTGNDDITAYRMTKADTGNSFYIVCNAADTAQQCSLKNTAELRNPQTGEQIPAMGSFTVASGQMQILIDNDVAAPVPTKVELTGETSTGVPYGDNALSYSYEARVFDQYGCTLDQAQVRYELVDAPENCSVGLDGTLVLAPGFKSGQAIRLKASCENVSDEMTILTDTADSVVTNVNIIGSNTLVVPEKGSSSYTYQAVFTNQSGASVSGVNAVWSLLDGIDGVQINSYTGALTVASYVPSGTIIHVNVAHALDPSVNQTLEIVLVKAAETGIYVNAPEELGVTDGQEAALQLQGYRTDQQGGIWQEGGIVYSLKQEIAGVSLSEDGKLVIDAQVQPGETIVIIAVSISNPANTKEYSIKLVQNEPVSIEIQGAEQIYASNIPVTQKYTTVVYDKNGNKTDAPVLWSVSGYNNITVENGTVTVMAGAGSGTAMLSVQLVDMPKITAVKKIKIHGFSSGGNIGGSIGGGGTGGGVGGGTGGIGGSTGNTSEDGTKPSQTELRFTDVPEEYWASEYIYHLVETGAVNGRTDTTFEPESNITRAEFVKILVQALQLQASDAEIHFSDVEPQDWYYESVKTAAGLGIVNGLSDSYFGAEDFISREQMAAMIDRTLRYKGKERISSTEAFADQDEISDYAEESVMALRADGILNGKGENLFMPHDNTTRAEAAKVICMICQMI